MQTDLYYLDFLADFSCKCGACRRTCCARHDWDIAMTSAEYDGALARAAAFRATGDAGDARPSALAAIEGLKPGADGLVRLPANEQGTCSLLDGDGLCSWRRQMGRDLCPICRDYPVMRTRIFESEFACPSGGCEAVLETLLNRQGRLELRTQPLTREELAEPRAFELDVSRDDAGPDSLFGAYPQVLEMAVDVLQDERRSLDQRMAILVTQLDVVSKMVDIGQQGRIAACLRSMADEGRADAMVRGFELDRREGNPAVRVCSELYGCCLASETYAPMAQRVLDNLGFSRASRNPRAKVRLRLSAPGRLAERREACRPTLERRSGFLSRVMLDTFMHSGVPLAGPNPWASARYFAVCYALIKFGIAGYFDGDPSDDELVDFLVLALRAFEHNGAFYRDTVRWMDGLGFTDARDFVRTVMW
jgi:hypothetical protein